MEHLPTRRRLWWWTRPGFLEKVNKSLEVQRRHSGTARRGESCQAGVFLANTIAQGRTVLDRELYLPQGMGGGVGAAP